MFAIAYHFHMLPRHHDHFRHDAFTLLLAWGSQTSFERFARTWVGVWMLNGMGLDRDAFAAPTQTDIGEETITPRVEGARHIHPARLRHDCHV